VALMSLALCILPVDLMHGSRASILASLRTSMVPFDASVETPSTTQLQFGMVATARSQRLAMTVASAAFVVARDCGVSCDFVVDGGDGAADLPVESGRSPPSDF
jgi:hypothetical protein